MDFLNFHISRNLIKTPSLEIKKEDLSQIKIQIKKSPFYVYFAIRVLSFILVVLIKLVSFISFRLITPKFMILSIKNYKIPFFSDLVILLESLIILKMNNEKKI